jgi:Fe2+ or Zn2+ uptake regulation protein
MRYSIYKNKILETLKKSHLLSITEIQRKIGGVDFSTIFRNVEKLEKDGAVRKVYVNKEHVFYEAINEKKKHEHFVCNQCGVIESVKLPKTLEFKGKIVKDILLRGECNKCK